MPPLVGVLNLLTNQVVAMQFGAGTGTTADPVISDVGVCVAAIDHAPPSYPNSDGLTSSRRGLIVGGVNPSGNATPLSFDGSGNLLVSSAGAPTTILTGKALVASHGSRVALSQPASCSKVTVKALKSNMGFIYVGNDMVGSSNGYQLWASESIEIDISNLSLVYLDSDNDGEGVTFIALAGVTQTQAAS